MRQDLIPDTPLYAICDAEVCDQAGWPLVDFARACLDRGYFVSFSGTVTFKNAAPLREALVLVPRDRLLVETDAPFLTPMPFRGRPNASYLVPTTVRAMAEVRGDDLEDLCRAIDATTDVAFGGPW